MKVACTLNNDALHARRERWRELGRTGTGGIVETPTGLRISFRSSPTVSKELHELAKLERECCAFATWRVWEDNSHVVLDVDSEGEGTTALHEMFVDFRTTLAGAD